MRSTVGRTRSSKNDSNPVTEPKAIREVQLCPHGKAYLPEDTFWEFHEERICLPCAKEQCGLGNHAWEIDCIGPSGASFSCFHCTATSSDLSNLKQMGFQEVK